jgi:NosR/NirI family transcriptional regulator, nitrous oxide reductase regulator
MRGGSWSGWCQGALALLCLVAGLSPQTAAAQTPFGEQRFEYEFADVLPAATVFDRVETHWRGYPSATRSELVGLVFLTDDVVDIPGYSGETLNTLVGIDMDGTITGVQVVRHAEPIVLIGLPDNTIHDFTDQYEGLRVTDRVVISHEPEAGYVVVDGISGATVTAMAENATVLEAARVVARAEGIVRAADVRTRRPSTTFDMFTWPELEARDAFGTIAVAATDLGLAGGAPAIDLRFTLLDPPSVGRNLLGDRFYAIVEQRLARDGGSALYVGANGALSFKGPGFARGGLFDRFQLEQDGRLVVFQDLDYIGPPTLEVGGAPAFRETGIFFTNDTFDPTAPFTFRLTVPYRVQDERRYATFPADYQLPDRFIASDAPYWMGRWQDMRLAIVFTALLLGVITCAFAFRQRLLASRKLLHYSTAVLATLGLGMVLKAQPSTTQILTLFGAARRLEFPGETFVSEPLIFILWISVIVTMVIWGRGFFCGWVCPYGALLEALIGVWVKVAPKALVARFDQWRPPRWLPYLKVAVFVVILAVSVVSGPLAEAMGEIEPFKTFVLVFIRQPAFVFYAVVITLLSVVQHRFFCRFLCPLGGALAVASTKAPLLPLFRYETCTRCTICARGCEPHAISFKTGRINYQECLQCWDCQATGTDEAVCPELIVAKREQRAPLAMPDTPVRMHKTRIKTTAAGIALALLVWPGTADADILRIAPGTLSAALGAAENGDLLVLEPGIHEGPISIDTATTVRGTPGAVLDGGGDRHAVVLAAPGAAVEHLAIRGCRTVEAFSDAGVWVDQAATGARVTDTTIEGCRFGVWVNGALGVEVRDNRIVGLQSASHNERGDCIHLWDADEARVVGNQLSHCRDGIYLELTNNADIDTNRITSSRYAVHTMWCDDTHYRGNYAHGNLVGLALMFSSRITAMGNILHDNRTHGLLWVQVTRGQAEGNVVIGNTKGLFIYNSLYNRIRGNLVARNNLGGHYWGGSEENVMEDNAFIQNEIQVKFVAARDQTWGGNFWSDYGGWDIDGDGVGETPYRSTALIDALLWKYPRAKLLLTSPVFQLLAFAERQFPVIGVPAVLDASPQMAPSMPNWAAQLERYPAHPAQYYQAMEKLPHVPGGGTQ